MFRRTAIALAVLATVLVATVLVAAPGRNINIDARPGFDGGTAGTLLLGATTNTGAVAVGRPGIATVLHGAIRVDGGSTFRGPVSVENGMVIDGGLGVLNGFQTTGGATVYGGATISGGITSQGELLLDGGLQVSQAAAFNSTLSALGASSLGAPFPDGGSVAAVKGIIVWTSAATDIASIDDSASSSTDFTLTGVAAGDVCLLVNGSVGLSTALTASCHAITDHLKLQFENDSGDAVDLAEQTYTFVVIDAT